MTLIDFLPGVPYRLIPGMGLQPAVDVALFLNGTKATTLGLVDSGAGPSVFGFDVARLLGITDVTGGDRVTASTLSGSFDFYLFDLEMEILLGDFRRRFPARAGFLPVSTSRNILGRSLLFSHFLIAFHERKQRLYFQPED